MASLLARSLLRPATSRLPTISRAVISRNSTPLAAFSTHIAKKPDMETAMTQMREYFEMPNDVLLVLATQGDHGARAERLVREIMRVEDCSWEDAQPKFNEISSSNKQGMWMATLPYKIGLTAGVVAGFASLPMVFQIDTALWFNTNYVTTEVPPDEDLETFLEVGSWTWNWMEPPLGTISFLLLTLQYARAQMQNLNYKPYTEWMQSRRASSLHARYPQYNQRIIQDFAVTDSYN